MIHSVWQVLPTSAVKGACFMKNSKCHSILSLLLTFCLVISCGTAASAADVSNHKTVTTSKTTSQKLSCAKPARSYTAIVSTKTTKISGVDFFDSGLIRGKYTGQKKIQVSDIYTKNQATKKRRTKTTITKNYVMTLAPSAQTRLFSLYDPQVKKAWTELGFDFFVDANSDRVNFRYSTKEKLIQVTMSVALPHLCLMLGHFISFAAGNAALTKAFKDIYDSEKASYQSDDRAFSVYNPSNFFAASARDYALHPDRLKKNCPKTYAYIRQSIGKINDTQIALCRRMLK